MTPENPCPPTEVVEAFSVGETPRNARHAEHIRGCDKCKARVSELQASRETFLREQPWMDFSKSLPKTEPAKPHWNFDWRWLAAPIAVAAGLLVFVLVPKTGEEVRWKGGGLGVVRVSPDGTAESLSSESTLKPGDRIQLRFTARRTGYLGIFGLDGNGKANVMFPKAGGASQMVQLLDDPRLPGTFEIDAEPGPEQFIVLFCDDPFWMGPVLQQLAKGPPTPGDFPRCRIEQLSLSKQP